MKILIYNTHSNQEGTYHISNDKSFSDNEPRWTLRIEGSVESQNKKFSSFFKKIIVQLDEADYKDDSFIEWDMNSLHPSDGFEITRKGHKDTTAKILLVKKNLIWIQSNFFHF